MKNININELLGKPSSLSETFYSKIINKSSKKGKNIKEKFKISYKGYNRFNEILLPKISPEKMNRTSLITCLENRQSKRKFSKVQLTKKQISVLLKYGCGEKNTRTCNYSSRYYPSAGAKYPLEIYLISLNTDYKKGLYHYYVRNHSLEELTLLSKLNYKNYFTGNFQKMFKNISCILLISAIFKRTTIKYSDRGYNYVMMEVGSIYQNLGLISSYLGLGCCVIGGFYEEPFNKLIDIDGLSESVIISVAIGK